MLTDFFVRLLSVVLNVLKGWLWFFSRGIARGTLSITFFSVTWAGLESRIQAQGWVWSVRAFVSALRLMNGPSNASSLGHSNRDTKHSVKPYRTFLIGQTYMLFV